MSPAAGQTAMAGRPMESSRPRGFRRGRVPRDLDLLA
jgi:hypothetical protein